MGSNECHSEKPIHKVEINSFYIGKYTVTNKEYSFYKGSYSNLEDDLPAVDVSWYDGVKYCNWLSQSEELEPCYISSGENVILDITKKGYRFPTEAEWEYACRGGTNTKYYWGDEMDGDYCWYEDNSEDRLHPVGPIEE